MINIEEKVDVAVLVVKITVGVVSPIKQRFWNWPVYGNRIQNSKIPQVCTYVKCFTSVNPVSLSKKT